MRWFPGSEVFAKARAIGLKVGDWQNVILVNMLGKRFYDETGRQFTPNLFGSFTPYTTGNWRNARAVKYNPSNFINARWPGLVMAGTAVADLGDFRCRCRGARRMGATAAAC